MMVLLQNQRMNFQTARLFWNICLMSWRRVMRKRQKYRVAKCIKIYYYNNILYIYAILLI